jgi:DNA repair exonuclease SbcCD ATPase subunit
LRKLNKYIPNLEQVKKQVIKNKQENNKVMTANIKQVLEDSKQVTKEIEKKENSPQVKEELKNVNQDLATLAESTQKLANISSKKDEQTLKVMTLEDMLIKKQTGQDSNELGQKFIDSCDNCYKILKKYDLDCPEKCDYDTAKKALNKLYLKYHPDRGGDPKIFREIRECGPMVVQDKCKNTNTGRKTSVDQNVVKELKQEIQEQKLDVKNLEVMLIKSQKTGQKTSEDQKVVKELKQEIKEQRIDVKNLEAMLKSKQQNGPKTSGQQMNLDAMLKNKQQKGPKPSDELKIEKELKQEIKELVSINTEVKNVTKVVDNNRKNLLADIQNLKSKVTSKETKTIIADISSDVKNICKGAKKWSASLNSCVCENEDEIENEDGICFNKKIVEKSTWYQEKGDDSQNVMDWIKDGNWFEDD